MRLLAVALLTFGFTATAEAREREWRLSPSVEFAYAPSLKARGPGASLSLAYGLRHWLTMEAIQVSWAYLPTAKDDRGADPLVGVDHVEYDLHRLHLLSHLILQPSISTQVAMRHWVPQLVLGAGLRVDSQGGRQSFTPAGNLHSDLNSATKYDWVLSFAAGIQWRAFRSFSVFLRTGGTMCPKSDGLALSLYAGLSFSFLFYMN
jgi:hypothetical protein